MAQDSDTGILSEAQRETRERIVELLTRAYWMEVETVMSYIAASVNPEGLRAQEVKESLATDILEELGHARRFAQRIKELYGVVPGSKEMRAEQDSLQPPADSVDIAQVIHGVIDAERGAIQHYNELIEVTDGVDPVTQDLVTQVLADEQAHLRTFEGFLREYESAKA